MHRASATAWFLCILIFLSTGSAQENQSKKSALTKLYIRRCGTTKLQGPFLETFRDVRMQPGERYRAPSVRYKINENGTVTNVKVLRYSGVKDIDQRLASSISNLKYAPRPWLSHHRYRDDSHYRLDKFAGVIVISYLSAIRMPPLA
jgi:hypothetical protein